MKAFALTVSGLSAAALVAISPAATAADLTLHITGIRPAQGPLYVGVQTQAQFMQPVGTYGTVVTSPSGENQTVVLSDVAPGDYSVSVLQDTDGNGTMTMQASGMPVEGWSMNNAASLRSLPTFDQVKFTVPATGNTELTLPMIYPR